MAIKYAKSMEGLAKQTPRRPGKAVPTDLGPAETATGAGTTAAGTKPEPVDKSWVETRPSRFRHLTQIMHHRYHHT